MAMGRTTADGQVAFLPGAATRPYAVRGYGLKHADGSLGDRGATARTDRRLR